MQFRQRRLFFKTTFEFGDEELSYTFENAKTKVGASIPYYKIPDRILYTRLKRRKQLYGFVFFAGMFLIMASYSLFVDKDFRLFSKMPLPLIGLVSFAILLFRGSAGIFPILTNIPPNQKIRVLEEKQHTTILTEIETRRRAQIKTKFAQVDFDKPYYQEAQKFKNLKEQDIITEQEYQQARQKIAAMRDKSTPTLPGEIRIN